MNLNFFTATFPHQSGETFIENEIQVIAKRFEVITIFPHASKSGENSRIVPTNCKIQETEKSGKLKVKDFILLSRVLLIELRLTSKKIYFIRHLRTWSSFVKQAILRANALENQAEINRETLCYSFWMNDWALVLTILKMRKKISKFVFRCGGFDIWDERHPGNYLPFRGVIYKYCDGVFPNSKKAEVYLTAKKLFPSKIKVKYWGTIDHGSGPFNENELFTLVSCSDLIPLKRVHLIVEILAKIPFKIRWIHFGDGPEMSNIKSRSETQLKQHETKFMGNVSNAAILDFYQKSSVNLFITTSSTEGLPVSLQEACSFGIPCLATDVGGISEVINNESGILIPSDFDVNTVAKQIIEFKTSTKNSLQNRKRIRVEWQDKFKAENTYNEFIDHLKSL